MKYILLLVFVLFIGCKQNSNSESADSTNSAISELLQDAMEYELIDKDLNALSIVLVDENQIVWNKTIGHQDEAKQIPASNETVFRVGSVSKLFTDIAIMQKVEKAELDLDAPIANYLPEFKPNNPYGTPITLRQLMSHRSGLLREPRIGNYFDAKNDNLKQTVESISNSTLVHKPGSKTKYSNAGIAVVGYVLEHISDQNYIDYMQKHILDVIGMTNSAFFPTPEIKSNLAEATMWSYDQRTFTAPTFQLGMAPAGSLYAPMKDLGRFMISLLEDGKGQKGQLITKTTLDNMWSPQFDGDRLNGYGIGFRLRDFHGSQQVGHGGAIYGFSTQLAAVPELNMGVACASSVDITNTVTSRLSNYALELMHASKKNEPLPQYEKTDPIDPQIQKSLAGYYQSEDVDTELVIKSDALYLISDSHEFRLKQGKEGIISDGRNNFGSFNLTVDEGNIILNERVFTRTAKPSSSNYPEDWNNLIGEYGDDHIILYIYENQGNLFALIEWFEKDKLTQLSENEFAFPESSGMYHGEKFIFERNADGLATKIAIENGPEFTRRDVGASLSETFTIEPVKPTNELRSVALNGQPPVEEGDFLSSDLVELKSLDPSFQYDIRYATTNNFMSNKFYTLAEAYLQRPAAEAVVRVHRKLQSQGLGLLIHDAYRPWYVTKMFYDATPSDKKIFVADPAKGSRHNRGAAVDLTLFDLKTGEVIEMVAGFDEMTDRSFPFYHGGNTKQRYYRSLLRKAMEAEGFSVYEYEWWHFDYKDWKSYGIGNTRFEDL